MRTLLKFGSSGSSSFLLSSPNLSALDRRRSPPAPTIAADRPRRPRSAPIALAVSTPPAPTPPHSLHRKSPQSGRGARSSDEPLIHSFPERTPPSPTREATSSSSTCINFFTSDLRCTCLAISNLFWSLLHIEPIGVGFDSGLGYVM